MRRRVDDARDGARRIGAPLVLRSARPRTGANGAADPGRSLRRLSHRPARGRRRTARVRLSDRARPRGRRPGRAAGRGRRGASRSAPSRRCRGSARACGHCPYCRDGRENLCDDPEFTGYNRDGGYATHIVAEAAFVAPLADDARRRLARHDRAQISLDSGSRVPTTSSNRQHHCLRPKQSTISRPLRRSSYLPWTVNFTSSNRFRPEVRDLASRPHMD